MYSLATLILARFKIKLWEIFGLSSIKVELILPLLSIDGTNKMDSVVDDLVAWTETLDESELENVAVS